ncbi:uncharacterized protein EI90DRAFT_3057440 [Cantharellus anzutake]|uniref:uncharacterized protein n=1 Tax=Cantharellus anzutake TaxID=1750568 RepID=UPI00190595A1|nr:uncharacterized protein EI90DRAFT_3057440 [Cantharellus anzutake]KAF8331297.1 hypothetical protein EI90DRAFT_3057440 [Cantharellus anzutake]
MTSTGEVLNSPVMLPCGRIAPNRFVKASMYEALADWWGGLPNHDHEGMYELWGKGGWGIILTGNAQVANDHLTLGRDIVVPEDFSEESCEPYERLAEAIHGPGKATEPHEKPLALLQVSHATRQSPQLVGGRIFAPPVCVSDVPLAPPDHWFGRLFFRLLFKHPTSPSDAELDKILDRFVFAARLAHKCKFDGVQLHGAHGYLLACTVSPKTNKRTPPYGPASLYILKQLVQRIRKAMPSDFVVAIKLNAADYVQGGLTEETALEHIKDIAGWAQEGYPVDLIEISGGTYENPRFLTSTRQALFSAFSRKALSSIRDIPNAPKIILTGSIRSVKIMMETITSGHADFVALARPSVPYPYLPWLIIDPASYPDKTVSIDTETGLPKLADEPSPWWNFKIPLFGAGVSTAWWVAFMARQSASQQKRRRPLLGKEISQLEKTLDPFWISFELFIGRRNAVKIKWITYAGFLLFLIFALRRL